jgi:crotonobetainyl-CoA:carnitine CoA-transferase CaiB-like acyl-CoA transferase
VPGFQLADVSGGLYSVIGIMGALMERARTGKGQVVDIAMLETAMPFAMAGFGLAFGGQDLARGAEALSGGIAPYQTYATKDGRAMSLAALEPKFWMQFSAGIGHQVDMTDLVPGPHQAELKAKLRAAFAEKTLAEWVQFASERDCCLEPVLTPDEARKDPHLAARGMFFEMASSFGSIHQMRTPLAPKDKKHGSPPKQGEHTRDVLRDAGLSDAEIDAMKADGAIR